MAMNNFLDNYVLGVLSLDDAAGNPVDILIETDAGEITFSHDQQESNRTGGNDEGMRYEKQGPWDGEIAFPARVNVKINNNAIAESLVTMVLVDPSEPRDFIMQWVVSGNLGFRVSGKCIISSNPRATLSFNRSTGQATINNLRLIPAGEKWAVTTTTT